jgi:transposase InsO family protein
MHGFIDGFSRLVLGIRANNNNRAETVLELFEAIAETYGYPSRVRGDHGTENLLVAGRQEHVRGIGRGSYIWGR